MTCYPATITLILFISFFTAHSMTAHIIPLTMYKYNESLPLEMKYHRGHILTAPIHVYLIWYGTWPRSHKHIIREFINSLTPNTNPSPSVAEWWKPLRSYTDQTGLNVSGSITLAQQKNDRLLSQGQTLTRLSIQSVIKAAIAAKTNPLPADERGVYLVLTADDIMVQDFCRAVCGFHGFTSTSIVGHTLPYAWIGNSHKLCPGFCAFPFAVNDYTRGHFQPLKAPNGVVGVDGMISVLAHELAEVATDPFATGWYAGDDPIDPIEVGDLCLAHYGMGAYQGVYVGKVLHDANGAVYNVNGVRRRFLVQWVYIKVANGCVGPNM